MSLLLGCGQKTLRLDDIKTASMRELGFLVASTYTESIARKERDIILELIIPGAPGQVIGRRCSSCGSRVLDNAFPRFATKKRTAHVVKTLDVKGCGRPGCKGRTDLIPLDEWQSHIRGTRKVLQNFPNQKGRGGSLKLCGQARWTIEKVPHFIIPRPQCKDCNGSIVISRLSRIGTPSIQQPCQSSRPRLQVRILTPGTILRYDRVFLGKQALIL